RIACRLRYKIVRIGVDNNSPADDVGCRSRSNRPVFGDYFEGTGAVFTYYEIVDITSMEFAAFRAIAVRMAHGIPVRARGCSIRCAAVAVLVEVNRVRTWFGTLHLQRHLHAIAGFFKGCLTREGASTRALNLGRSGILFC